jgi:hypothetical protein
MVARLLPGTALRVRRGRRRDLAQVERVLGREPGPRSARLFRRVLADLGNDVYVAEDARGEIVGIVTVTYPRSLVRGGLVAVLDGARARNVPAGPVLEGLVAFAEERARRRGCRRLTAWLDAGETELRAMLLARGYRAGEVLVADLGGSA